jgi:hypothetical protein
MSFFEIYRMNIPILAPSKTLLVTWHMQHNVINELTWDKMWNGGPQPSKLPPHPSYATWPDPNVEDKRAGLEFWFEFCDIYQFPHITYFDSIDDLVAKSEKITQSNGWRAISDRMKEFNTKQLSDIQSKFRTVYLPRMFGEIRHPRHNATALGMNYRDASRLAWPGIPDPCY